MSTEENLRAILIHSFLRVTSVWNVLNDDFVVDLRRFRIENFVGSEDIINTRFLAEFL